ncbi:MAG TPA: DNA topoisomerase IB [Jiangellaceae bacterium]|nr:DNA topoisomerase IB [Jiangellaceae bacterium]
MRCASITISSSADAAADGELPIVHIPGTAQTCGIRVVRDWPAGYLLTGYGASEGASEVRLRRWDPAGPAICRRRRGRGFSYTDPDGQPIADEAVLQRIANLVIPPAWRDVRICPWPNGHLQAVGTDDAGRRQYLYHPAWRELRDREKFYRLRLFAERLPSARAQIAADLATRGLNRRRVLATAARLLDIGFFRIGGEEYAEDNGSYGLATVLREHVSMARNGTVIFDYPAKWGLQRIHAIADQDVVSVIQALRRRREPGESLLAYYEGRQWKRVRSEEINDYLKEIFGTEVTAKDFRTWHATVLAAVSLSVVQHTGSRTARKRALAHTMREVSHYLGNTPAVSRSSYVDPHVVEAYEQGETVASALDGLGDTAVGDLATHGRVEEAVLKLLNARHPTGV